MATLSIYPAEGVTAYDESGTVIPTSGITVTLTDYYYSLLRDGTVLDWNPLGSAGTPSEPGNQGRASINVLLYGATGDGSTDDTSSIRAAIAVAQASGKAVYLPAGSYLVSSTLTLRPTAYVNNFGRVPSIFGDGVNATTILTSVNGALFDLDSSDDADHDPFKGLIGAGFRDFSVRKSGSPSASTAIKIRTCYHVVIERLWVYGMSGNGIEITTALGDLDASIVPVIRDTRIENCAGWGISAVAATATNESSFVRVENVFIQGCGTVSSSTPPPSGGMQWKGQILSMENCCFTINENCALYIPGAAGLGSNASVRNTAFENSKKRHIYCTGVNGFRAENIQLYNNDSYVATTAVEFDGSTYTVRNVQMDIVTVRATTGNSALTEFKISGTNAELDTCRIRNVDWQNYDYTGQTRFDGWQFDPIPQLCHLVFVNDEIIRLTPAAPGRGNSMPMRLNRAIDGHVIVSQTGEWVTTTIATDGEALAPTVGGSPVTLIEGGAAAASTRYHVYLYMSGGSRVLGLSSTVPTVDPVSGYWVRTGQLDQLWVGCVTTTSAAAPNIRWSHVESAHHGGLVGSALYDPANLVDGAGVTTTVTVTGASLGDYAHASFSLDLQGITLTAWVSSSNTVSVRFQNESGGAIDLGSGVIRARVVRA